MVVLLSPEAKASIWVRREISYAQQWEIPIIPVLVRGSEHESIPFHVNDVQWLDLRDSKFNAGNKALVQYLQKLLNSTNSPSTPIVAGENKLREQYEKRQRFWKRLIERSKGKTHLFVDISPSINSYIGTGAGKTGLVLRHFVYSNQAGVDLYIDAKDFNLNKGYFDALFSLREEIEADFGEPLDWRRLADNRASRIVFPILNNGGLDDPDTWDALQDKMIETVTRLDKALRSPIQKL